MSAPSTTKVRQNWEEEAERSTATSKVKAEVGRGGGTHIEIMVRSATAEEDVFFRIRRDVKIGPLMDMYCDKHSIRSRNDVAFMDADMGRIDPYKTPDEIGLEDGEAIYVWPHQTGS